MKIIPFILLILSLCVNTPLFAYSAKGKVKEGNTLYNKGQFKQALEKYQDALSKLPESDIVNFNTGSALYKNGDYNGAISHFEKSLLSDEPFLQQKASFNLGNSRYKYGISKEESDLQQAVDLLSQSLNNYQRSLQLNPDDEDAKYNYEFVKKELKRLKEKLKQQDQQCQLPDKQQDKEEKDSQQSKQEQSQSDQEESDTQKEQSQLQQQEESQEQQAEEPSQEKEDGTEEQFSQGKQQQPSQEISKEQARMLLEAFRQQEEPRGLYKPEVPTRGPSEPSQDW